ncbi:glycine betaine/L-proline ABC transporter substrate-binding protein ProX [Roseovarius sp. CAU 1744]|uniref:glycine betaine/L-proline ABC transporter substrate-binding protein ProX n=1 Tax=Roseovarius sp. CAU 1744 TaxID=3140368 RepID=UPI00325ADCA0
MKPMMNRVTRLAATTAAAALAGSLAFAAGPGDGKTAYPVRPNWDTFWFGQYILDIGLEKLGYEIDHPKTLSGPPMFASLAQGDSHYAADTISPNHDAMYEEVGDAVIKIGPLMEPGSLQGYLIDRKTSEAHGIKYVEDLLKPEVAALFDSDGDGRAEMIGPSVGWGAETVALHQFEALGLDKTVQMVQGEYSALAADAAGRLSDGEAVLIYAWYPNATTLKLRPGRELVWLQMKTIDLPGDQEARYKPITGDVGCSGGDDPCDIGWLPTVYYIAVNRAWGEENPAVLSLFNSLKMDLSARIEQNARMAEGETREDDIRRHAEDWIAANQEQFDTWLDTAREAAN